MPIINAQFLLRGHLQTSFCRRKTFFLFPQTDSSTENHQNSIKLTFSFSSICYCKKVIAKLLFTYINGSKLVSGCAKRGSIRKKKVPIARLHKVKSRLINLTVWVLNFLIVKTFKCWTFKCWNIFDNITLIFSWLLKMKFW